jgi:hypothetical protein
MVVAAALRHHFPRQPCSTANFQALASILWPWVPASNHKNGAKRVPEGYPAATQQVAVSYPIFTG